MLKTQGISPRFELHQNHFNDIKSALDTTGHVILDNVLDKPLLEKAYAYSQHLFAQQPDHCSTSSYTAEYAGHEHNENFIANLASSNLPDLFYHLFSSSQIAAIQGPALRCVDPNMDKHIGLHCDVQTRPYLTPETKNAMSYSVWIPFQDIDEATPRLLLFDKQLEVDTDQFDTGLQLINNKPVTLLNNGKRQNNIDLRPAWVITETDNN